MEVKFEPPVNPSDEFEHGTISIFGGFRSFERKTFKSTPIKVGTVSFRGHEKQATRYATLLEGVDFVEIEHIKPNFGRESYSVVGKSADGGVIVPVGNLENWNLNGAIMRFLGE